MFGDTGGSLAKPANSADAGTTASVESWTARRVTIAGLTIVSILGSGALLIAVLVHGKLNAIAGLAIAAFLVNMTWVALGFWNALVGFLLLHGINEPSARIWPALKQPGVQPISAKPVAVVMTLHNDGAEDAFNRVKAVRKSLQDTASDPAFDYYILSDSSLPDAIESEEQMLASWRVEDPSVDQNVVYRRRATNWGFKPGNIREFCARWGSKHEFMVLLDVDSIMSGEAIVRLVRIMQNNPQLGIIQSLIVGVLCPSLFARLFEYGHRHGLRCSLAGAAWWQGDRCQYWGHNAVIRLSPFAQYCEMPYLPGKGPFSGHIFCHDQIEASFMHRAGYEVRVLPEESGSYEGVPPTLFDFNRRNNRWCQGNLKNLRVVPSSGLSAIDRFHLMVVAQRFVSHPALVISLISTLKSGTEITSHKR